jgi:hypothetical protein
LGHPHIIAVHDFGAGDEPYIVMEYFLGVSLNTLAERGPLRFVARHEHAIGHCTGDLSLGESGLSFVAPRKGEWRFSPERIEALDLLSDIELALRARTRGEEEDTFRFTFLRPALQEAQFREYRSRVLVEGIE